MRTDPANQRVLKIVFDINSNDAATLPILIHSYMNYLYDEEVISRIKPYIDKDAENKYISELFFDEVKNDEREINGSEATINGNRGVVDINMILTEDAEAKPIVKADV